MYRISLIRTLILADVLIFCGMISLFSASSEIPSVNSYPRQNEHWVLPPLLLLLLSSVFSRCCLHMLMSWCSCRAGCPQEHSFPVWFQALEAHPANTWWSSGRVKWPWRAARWLRTSAKAPSTSSRQTTRLSISAGRTEPPETWMM